MEERIIVIKEENGVTNFNTKGFSDIEIIGILSYYKDLIQIELLRKNEIIKTES